MSDVVLPVLVFVEDLLHVVMMLSGAAIAAMAPVGAWRVLGRLGRSRDGYR
ncbi:MAG: hypothetical protein OXH38_11785 [Chloroflexi bacterium]|nr:hypothetical protein [Chloroflexota bacterium]